MGPVGPVGPVIGGGGGGGGDDGNSFGSIGAEFCIDNCELPSLVPVVLVGPIDPGFRGGTGELEGLRSARLI